MCASLYTATWHALPAHASVPPPDSIATYAGGVGSGLATLIGQQPGGVAVHGTVLYVADDNYDVVRAIDMNSGQETVVAGGALPPGCTEPCPATSAFIFPQGIAVDAAGNNLYITDFGQTLQGVVRKVDLITGTMYTFAGGGAGCAEPCTAASATTVTPDDVTVDGAGNVFFADFGDNRVRKVDTLGQITTIVGSGNVSGASGVAVDSSGNVYFSDFNHDVVKRLDHITSAITVFAGGGGSLGDGGPATSASLYRPIGLRLDTAGNVYIAERGNGRVRKVDTAVTPVITTYAGGGALGDGNPANMAHLSSPTAVALDGTGNLFIADFYDLRVRRVDHTSPFNISTFAGLGTPCGPAGDGGQALAAQVCQPAGMTFDGAGNLYFADVPNGRIRKITPAGVVSTVAGGGTGTAEGIPATSASLNKPNAVVVDTTGRLFIADTYNHKIRMVNGAGIISTIAGNGVNGYNGDNQPATSAELYLPSGVAVNGLGDVFIADQANSRVRKVDHATQVITTVAGTTTPGFSGDSGPGTSAQLNNPISVALDGAGSLYISDNGNWRVRKVTAGIITTYAGGGAPSCPASSGNGDGLPAICASLSYPQQISIDAAGRLFIANGLTRVVSSDGYISTLAGCNYGVDPGCLFNFVEGGIATSVNVGAASVALDAGHNAFIGSGTHIWRVQAPLAPASPSAVMATAGDSQVSVSWTGGAANGNPVYRYTVTPYRGVTPLTPIQVTGYPLPTSTTINLANGPSYTFNVSASNAFGASPDSPASNAVVPSLAPVGRINTHAGSVGSGSALLLGQMPYSLALAGPGSHLYAGDWANGVVRDINTGTGQEGALAGEVAFGYSGDGGPATSAMIQGAGAMVNCGPGLTYIADTYNYVIRQVDGGGVITTIAGNGNPGYSGDGGPAISASLSRVFGLACRSGGGLYISDSDNGAVRILDAVGKIETWWSGFSFPTGIVEVNGLDNVDVSDSGSLSIVANLTDTLATLVAGTINSPGYAGDNGPARSAKLNHPRGLARDNGWLFIADTSNHRVRAVDSVGQITTVAGTGMQGFSGDGPDATAAQLNLPTDVAVDTSTFICNHALYIADSGNFRVRSTSGQQCSNNHPITTVAGNGTPSLSGDGGPALQAQLGNPFAIAVDAAGNQFIADASNNVIRKIDPTGVISTVVGTGLSGPLGDNGPALSATLSQPRGVALNAAGDIFISDTLDQRVRKVDHVTHAITTIAGTGTAGFSGDGSSGTNAQINLPQAVVVDGTGNVYIAEYGNDRVRKVTPGGVITTFAGNGLNGYGGDGGAATAAKLNHPRGLAVDAGGNVLIADSGNNRVRKVTPGGVISTVAGNGVAGIGGDNGAAISAELNYPAGLAVDGPGGVYIADTHNQSIRLVDASGRISTVVSECGVNAAFYGDGGQAALAHVNLPIGVAVDAYGNLFIADVNDNRVRGATGLAGIRPASCPSLGGVSGTRNASQSSATTGPGGVRIADGGGSARRFMFDAVLPGRVTSSSSQLTLVPSRHQDVQSAPVKPPAAAQPAPPLARPVPASKSSPLPLPAQHAPSGGATGTSYLAVIVVLLANAALVMLAVRRRRHRLS